MSLRWHATWGLTECCILCNSLVMTHALRSFRSEADITLDVLAEQVGVSKGQLSKIENGRSLPSLDLVARLVAASGGRLSADDFLPVEAAR